MRYLPVSVDGVLFGLDPKVPPNWNGYLFYSNERPSHWRYEPLLDKDGSHLISSSVYTLGLPFPVSKYLLFYVVVLEVDFTDFNSHFVSICLGYCILSLLGTSQYWASFLQKMLSLLFGAILFCCFIVSNFQLALRNTGKHKN